MRSRLLWGDGTILNGDAGEGCTLWERADPRRALKRALSGVQIIPQ